MIGPFCHILSFQLIIKVVCFVLDYLKTNQLRILIIITRVIILPEYEHRHQLMKI